MSNPGTPVGQLAYQASMVKGYGAAMKHVAQTANRYSGGSNAFNASAGSTNPIAGVPLRRGRRTYWTPCLGGAGGLNGGVSCTAGTAYVANDVVTFVAVNGGRPIVVTVLHVTAGNPDQTQILDPGSGLALGNVGINQQNPTPANIALTVASSTGASTNGTWVVVPGTGWVYGQPNPLA